MAYKIPEEIAAFLIKIGFKNISDGVYTIPSKLSVQEYRLLITQAGDYIMFLETIDGEIRDRQYLFYGYEVKSVEELDFLIMRNSFFNPK